MDRLARLENLEKKVLKEEKKIERAEVRIESEEKAILRRESRELSLLSGFGLIKGKFVQSRFASRFKKHKVLYSFITLVSVIMIWTGVQAFITKAPGISNPLISIPLGLLIVWIIDRELV